jgi:hypothetical protein
MKTTTGTASTTTTCEMGGCIWMLTFQGWECFEACTENCSCTPEFPGPYTGPVPVSIYDPFPVVVLGCEMDTNAPRGVTNPLEIRFCVMSPDWKPNQPYIAAIYYSDVDPAKTGWRLVQRKGTDFSKVYDLGIPGAFPGMLVIYLNGKTIDSIETIVGVGYTVQPRAE